MLTKTQIEQFLRDNRLAPLKSLGQNFLLDETVLEQMVKTADIGAHDTVLEIGPGLGFLTDVLGQKAGRVVALEKDRGLAKHLEQNYQAGKVQIVAGDVLRLNLPELLAKQAVAEYKLVANIPYYITSAIIKLFLTTERQPQSMTLLVQQEVAERICAAPGEMSVLALSVQLLGEPQTVMKVPRTAFYPAPDVDSAILHIAGIGKRFADEEYRKFFRLIKIGFAAKRKKLVNNLSNGLQIPRAEVEKVLIARGLSADIRAQDLSPEDWVGLVKGLRGDS